VPTDIPLFKINNSEVRKFLINTQTDFSEASNLSKKYLFTRCEDTLNKIRAQVFADEIIDAREVAKVIRISKNNQTLLDKSCQEMYAVNCTTTARAFNEAICRLYRQVV
jgi:hypothetical protein